MFYMEIQVEMDRGLYGALVCDFVMKILWRVKFIRVVDFEQWRTENWVKEWVEGVE